MPAATTTVMPSSIIDWTARSTAEDAEPPRLRLATAGTPFRWSARIQSMAAMRMLSVVDPEQFNTFTGMIEAALATP